MTTVTRRLFLKSTATLSAGLAFPVRSLRAASPLEQVNVGIVGCGGQGNKLLTLFSRLPGVKIAGLCDADSIRLNRREKEFPEAARWRDMRHMFDSPDIDAVVIATCNHWHCLAAIWAMEAGKHVYVEKPLGHTQWEGEQVVSTAAKYKRICQVGTQQRSDPMQAEIKQFLHEDKAIGEIESVRVNRFGVRQSIGRRSSPLVPPKSVDYNLWVGPAQEVPIYRDKLHYDWHWDWNTGSGEMGNWGVHIIDDVRNNIFRDDTAAPISVTAAGGRFVWNDAGDTPNVHFAVLEVGEVPVVVTLSNLPVEEAHIGLSGPDSGYIAYCSGGRLEGQRGKAVAFDSAGKLIKKFAGDGGNGHHQENFIDTIRSARPSQLAASAQIGHDSTTWCNLINIATRLPTDSGSGSIDVAAQHIGSELVVESFEQIQAIITANDTNNSTKRLQLGPTLRFDPDGRRFVGEHARQANQLLRREYRKPFVVPESTT